jgi:acetylornithine deacetylase/succinyl-diaminopimelate desuccinylase-like protein
VLKELQTVGYEASCVDDWGNVMGMVRGNAEGPTIMYNAHLDHADIGDPSEWGGYDPYGGQIDLAEVENQTGDGMEMAEVIHGRAASDTKGGMACQIYSGAILIRLMKEGYTIKGNYLFTASVLEEPAEQIGMIGLYEHTLQQKGYTVDGVVSCESTSLKLYLGHRGRVELDVEICGVTAHASAPWLGLNAVNKATKFVDAVEASVMLHK